VWRSELVTKTPAIQRQWRLLEKLHGRRTGLTARTLLEELGTSRATFYRDLRLLQDAGFKFATEEVNGEVRYRLLGEAMPPVQPSSRQVLALRLARRMLAPLEGTRVLRELDVSSPRKSRPPFTFRNNFPLLDPTPL
jgi:predicted DNA-binding transcriptional regulator YafY